MDNPRSAAAMADLARRTGRQLIGWHRDNMLRHGVDTTGVRFFGVSDPEPEEGEPEQ